MDTCDCKFESKIIGLCESVVRTEEIVKRLDLRINGSIGEIEKHIDNGHKWRLTIAGVAFTVIMNVIVFANLYGALTNKVEDSAREIEILRAKTGVDNARMERSITALENKK